MRGKLWVGAGLGALLTAHAASAQLVVDAPALDFLNQLQVGNQVAELGKWAEQLRGMQQQYQTLMNQYQAIAHLPQNIGGMASALTTTPALQNPLPQASQITGILNGSALGPVTTLANQFRTSNTAYAPTGDDGAAVEMRRRADSTAGLQAMATNAMHSLEQRVASLGEFLGGIGDSPDVQQSAAIQARLQLEQNYVATQQVQAQQLAVLAAAQQQVAQQRDVESSRRDAETWRTSTSWVWEQR